MSGHGQTLHDRLTAARHTLAGQGLARIVCKATTEEIIGPKRKHLDYLLHCTNEPNVSIPQLANLLIERTQHSSWVVVFKALITVHHLMVYGNERFTQYLASNNCTFQLSNFLDKSTVQSAYDMSTFIRRYAKYLNEKALSYRTVAFDFCKVKRGKDDGMLRTMNTDKLLKTVPVLQSQLDSLLEFDCTANDLTNGVINSCFMLLFRDLIRLFACYNDGIINLLEKYFDMNKKNCRDALDIYKKFLIRMDRVAEFLKVAENVGIDKGEIPDLTKAPSSLLDALEQHLASVEGKKGATVTSPAARSTNLKIAVSALSSISNSFGNVASNGMPMMQEVNGIRLDESAKKALEEEAVAMNQLKFDGDSPHNNWEQPSWDNVERRMKEMHTQPSTDSTSAKTNPFLTSPSNDVPQTNDSIVDLFSTPPAMHPSSKASEDLLCLSGNPFADSLYGGAPQPPPPIPTFMAFGTNGFQTQNSNTGFSGDSSFAMAFGSTCTSTSDGTSGFDAFGDMLQPTQAIGGAANKAVNGTDPKNAGHSLIKGDLDSSLASLCQNLDINGPKHSIKKPGGHQWGSPKIATKTGGANWSSGPGTNGGQQWGAGGMMAGPFPQQPPSSSLPQQQFPIRPMAPAGMGMGMGVGMGVTGSQHIPPQQPQQQMGMFMGQRPPGGMAHTTQPTAAINDPFGAL